MHRANSSDENSILFSLLFDKSSAVVEMGDCLATIEMGRKVGGCCAPLGGLGEGFLVLQTVAQSTGEK